jgi:hypothetical protein
MYDHGRDFVEAVKYQTIPPRNDRDGHRACAECEGKLRARFSKHTTLLQRHLLRIQWKRESMTFGASFRAWSCRFSYLEKHLAVWIVVQVEYQ